MEYSCQRLPLSSTGAFSDLFLNYINQDSSLSAFYHVFPVIENFKELIQQKSFSTAKREVLVNELRKQYSGIESNPNFDLLLDEKTFTVTTGHQLNIFSGPLYIPFKIITILNLAKQLKEAYPGYNFVPIYWMATEDHDLEEIQSFRAFGKKMHWDTHQTGAVGRMKTDGLAELGSTLGKAAEIFLNAYRRNSTLANAVREYMHSIFGAYGLITLDADSRDLKSLFSEVMKDDILNQTSFDLVNKQTNLLENLGYKTQISAREINFFYLADGVRERIVKEDNHYRVLQTEIRFSQSEILELIENEPEHFSPNVVLRPLYEEVILPNLAYIGGPSEVPYWLQLKSVFDHYGEMFPALMPRNFGMLVNKKQMSRCDELEMCTEDFFKPVHELEKSWVQKHSGNELSLASDLDKIKEAFKEIISKTLVVDSTLSRTAEAFNTKTTDLIQRLEKKLIRAEKRKFKETLNKIEQLKESLFPSGGMQERKENIIPFLEAHPGLIDQLIGTFDPLDYRFNIISV